MHLHFESADFLYDPYPIGTVRPALSPDLYERVVADWPPGELFKFQPQLGKKYSLSEVNHPEQYHAFLKRSPVWQLLHAEIKSQEFVSATLAMLRREQVDLGLPENPKVNSPKRLWSRPQVLWDLMRPRAQCRLKTRFEFSMLPACGGHIKPHTDAPAKLITLVVSVVAPGEWKPEWGGGTAVLRSNDPRRRYNQMNIQQEFKDTEHLHTFPFEPNQYVVFVKTFNSLHAVYPMTGDDERVMRRTLTINIELDLP